MLGTARERPDARPPARADALAELTLPDHEGKPLRLGDLWRDGPAALVWLRQYG